MHEGGSAHELALCSLLHLAEAGCRCAAAWFEARGPAVVQRIARVWNRRAGQPLLEVVYEDGCMRVSPVRGALTDCPRHSCWCRAAQGMPCIM